MENYHTAQPHSYVIAAWDMETDGPLQLAGQPEEPKQQVPAPVNDQVSKIGRRAIIEEDTKINFHMYAKSQLHLNICSHTCIKYMHATHT